ncbi:hypothetical protein FV219_01585 [Methylobacterium sp. WL122]|nr:hypothetical protein FV219_01585 [Methylobacterium sp. WL122]
MSRRAPTLPYVIPPADLTPVFEAVAEAAGQVEVYAHAATNFAAIGDARGLAYSLRCAAASLMAASGLADELRPSRQIGGRVA